VQLVDLQTIITKRKKMMADQKIIKNKMNRQEKQLERPGFQRKENLHCIERFKV